MNRAAARASKTDFDGAIEDCTEALKINPRHDKAFLNRGMARQQNGDLDGAIDDYTKVLEVAPPNWPYRKQVEKALRAAQVEKGSGN